jgi:hypothetical protein
MQSLIEFLGGYEPLYPQVVEGYPPEAIARLEEALGRPLPSAYRDFLATAAANIGFPHHDLTFDIEEVLELTLNKRATLPNRLTPIAVDLSPSYTDYYLDLGRPAGEGDGAIVCSAAGSNAFDDLWYVYPSLRDMLFFWGFERVRKLTLIHSTSIGWELGDFADPKTAPSLAELHRQLEQLGFRALGVTGPTMPLYERGDCAASVGQSMDGPTFAVYLASNSELTVNIVAETLCDGMPGHGVRRPG